MAYLFFPEDRLYPIRMTDHLPVRWIERGPRRQFEGETLGGEFYVFQIGVYASRATVPDIQVEFRDLRGPGARIPASAIR